jgi:hypothetical protein
MYINESLLHICIYVYINIYIYLYNIHILYFHRSNLGEKCTKDYSHKDLKPFIHMNLFL